MIKRIGQVVVCAIVSIVMALSNLCYTYSATLNDLTSQKSEIEKQKQQAENELKQLQSTMTSVEKQVSELNKQIEECQGKIDDLNVEITLNEDKLAKAQADYEKRYEIFVNRIVAQYEAGDVTYLDMLLESDGIVDFLSRSYYVEEMANMDVALMDELERTKQEIEETKAKLEQDKAELSAQKSSLQAKKSERQTYINQLSDDKKAVQTKRDELDEELEKVKKEIASLASKNTTYLGSGIMAWPTPGYYTLSYGYGYRVHPVYKTWKLHTGIDIAAPTGANFVAAESGTVIVAQTNYYGYGTCVAIDHGGGIITLYGHGSQLLVSNGQYVTKGTPVLKVGSTGVSTGPHAHFEVRVNGTTTDPMKYVSNK